MKTKLFNIKFILSLLASVIFATSFAQQGINYQGVARNNNGELMQDQDLSLEFNIKIGAEDGDIVYTETHSVTTDINGVFSVIIGEGTPVLNTFDDINWANDRHFLNVWLDSEEIGTTEFKSTPYTKAIGKWQAYTNGLMPKGTGGSIYVGDNAGVTDNLNDNYNIGVGYNALNENTDGQKNIALGYESLKANQTGNENIALGYNALKNNVNGYFNVSIGTNALHDNTSGYKNVAVGPGTLLENLTGVSNIAIGPSAMQSRNDGHRNIAVGGGGLLENINGTGNVALGTDAGYFNEIGDYNLFLGHKAGQDNLGSNNVFIGYRSGFSPNFDDVSNTLIIDNTTESSPLIYGEFDNEILAFDAKVGIGLSNPNVPLQIATGSDADLGLGSGMIVLGDELGSNLVLDKNEIQARNGGLASSLYLQQNGGNIYVGDAIIQSSDIRLKKDIQDISYGLQEILKLRPAEYYWKDVKKDNKSLGLIAQEVQTVIKNLVTNNAEQDKYGVSYTELIPILIKAMQEQHEIIQNQHSIITEFDQRLTALEKTQTSVSKQ
ncbi:MAG: tail fiber domain-containing protein [Bacteroidota bacterium]